MPTPAVEVVNRALMASCGPTAALEAILNVRLRPVPPSPRLSVPALAPTPAEVMVAVVVPVPVKRTVTSSFGTVVRPSRSVPAMPALEATSMFRAPTSATSGFWKSRLPLPTESEAPALMVLVPPLTMRLPKRLVPPMVLVLPTSQVGSLIFTVPGP